MESPPDKDLNMKKGKRCPCPEKNVNKREKKCREKGRITGNPFFNFLRMFREKQCGLNVCQIAVQGAKIWNQMTDKEKKQFKEEASRVKKQRGKLDVTKRRRSDRKRR